MAIVTWDSQNKHADTFLSVDKLVATLKGNAKVQYVRANEYKYSGKYYYELTIEKNYYKDNSNASRMYASIIDTKTLSEVADYRERPLHSTTGVAVDLDNKNVDFYLEGKIVSSYSISNFEGVIPEVRIGWIADGLDIRVNFGATPFKYPIPTGYEPYQKLNKTLILKENEYLTNVDNQWVSVSNNLPTLQQFQEEGMDDLSILDRKVQQVIGSPQQMTATPLGEGKVFKGTVDLKKLFDLRKLEVK